MADKNKDKAARLERRKFRTRKNIFGIGLNYVEHVAESSRALDTAKELPKQPVIFSKPPTSVIGPHEAIEHNKAITQQLEPGQRPPGIPGFLIDEMKLQGIFKTRAGLTAMVSDPDGRTVELVGAERTGEGIVGNTDNHRAFSIT